MSQQFKLQRLVFAMTTAGLMAASVNAHASAFQLWEQDAASIGNYHAGIAASADDASTSYYNPAGMVRIHNQQMIIGMDPVLTNFKYNGSVIVTNPSVPAFGSSHLVAQGGNTSFVPFGHYVSPIADNFFFGFSVVVPFGLMTDYGHATAARYAATKTALSVVDVTPSLGFAVDNKLSFGAGLDYQHAEAELDLMAGIGPTSFDTASNNEGKSNSFGYHLGALYQFDDATRIGLVYHSQVVHHLRGTSKFSGNLANFHFPGSLIAPSASFQDSDQMKGSLTLPPVTSLSIFHTFNSTWDGMGSVSYTQWSVLRNLVLQNVAGVLNATANSSIVVVIPEKYRNTWNLSVGANYHLNEKVMFRGGVGYDETPSNDQARNLQLPDSDRIAVGLGAHFQASKAMGLDVGWTHFFAMNTRINNLSQTVGDQTSTTNGSVSASADVYGLQVKWDIT